ncbi:inactive ubiquitin carboxyl-terminal hydrolase 50 isoform X1 [Cyanistes caeruleus]|uniref:inactive ubiquitin carboxyl-terminal hydrolase 50 isoform X1 n=1 Tax=Cyanistes caeruleus TaxID=156563 RepID=UPI000CDB5753|nr:inactive ubiquitin carboxyl-terminal hydrolase 50 isoform X1 [Cyanistes caeruleus]XP_023789727.1 inactive ubiquitin carboxyl-terminal hydrolase 50 isoform X1 [Cyanistes caeruleus]XP_023789729.1 inactive ubiquitin carboxyl-terminal hydrolase 50 isoform X1 [Cyanistes caeruleus]XP_023789730.1 inactive ubiquitin carboxyl-terminal hydrolase 50 isoform X1 [Cyanistes caeruleus]
MAWKWKYSPKEQLEDISSLHPGLTGLQNLENTCYMNAVLQCLCSLTPLVQHFLSGTWNTALHEEIGESATAFGCLVSDMWLGEFDYVSPEAFHSIFEKRYPAFSRRTQHDAQEFLICVLDDLHEAFKEPSQERQSPAAEASTRSSSGTSIITELFEGQLSYGIRCLRCKALSHRPESFTILSLPIPSTRVCSLQDCLECFFQPDTLTQNNQIHCYWCGGNQDATVKASITKAPQIIIFHLKRFAWQDKHRRKLSTTVCYPFSDLDLSPYISASCCNNTEYSLCAVVNHAGDLDYGHYTAFCKHAVTKHWYSFDDAQVTEIPDSEVQADTAYLLFYTSKGY